MKPTDIFDLTSLTKAVQGIPKSWQRINKSYIQPITSKEIVQLNTLAVLVGMAAGYASVGLRYMIGYLQHYSVYGTWGDGSILDSMADIGHIRLLILAPLGFLFATVIAKYFASEAKGHGVPEVVEAVWMNGGVIRKRVVFLKAIASAVTIAVGGSVGQEGPIVQMGSAIGSTFGQLFSLKPKLLKTLVGCGAAGAVAATFNTPIAAVIFAIEIIVLELKTKSFVPLVISSVLSTVVVRSFSGSDPAFIVPQYSLQGPEELIFFLALAILSGIVGVVVIRSVYGVEDFFDHLKVPFWVKPLIAGSIIAAIGIKYPEMLGIGYKTLGDVLQQNGAWQMISLFVVLKIIAASVTLGGGGSGGVFAPALFVGAMLGGSYGYFVHHFFPDITSSYGAYAVVGMAAMFSATTRATFTAIVILFELTLDYSLILPVMFVCVIADQVSWALCKESIFSMKIVRKGLKYASEFSVNAMTMTFVKDIMTTSLHTIKDSMTIQEADALVGHNHSVYPVINDSGALTGIVKKEDLVKFMQENPSEKIGNIKRKAKAVVKENSNVHDALTKIDKTRDPRILVVDKDGKKLVGIISPVDLVRLSLETEHELVKA